MKSIVKLATLLLALAAAMVLILFMSQNSDVVEIQFFNWSVPAISLASAILLSFVFGFLLASLFFSWDLLKTKYQVNRSKRSARSLQKRS